jgi:hypothetical protein
MSTSRPACCTSTAALCYWFAASLVAGGLLLLVEQAFPPSRVSASAIVVLAMGIGCVANFARNRTYHCAITGPLFLVAGLLFALSDKRILTLGHQLLWGIVLVGAGIAHLLERTYARPAR